jgi:hypothetical protein
MIAPPSAMTAPSATAFGERSPSDPSIAAAPTKRYVLQVLKHPPAKALYRRTLKPAPVVALLPIDESTPSDATSTIPSLLVEAVLVRSSPGSDIEEELPTDGLLDGVTSVPVAPGGFASFKKLKIMCTSQQMGGAFFRVKFKLSRYISGEPIRPPGALCSSGTGSTQSNWTRHRKSRDLYGIKSGGSVFTFPVLE